MESKIIQIIEKEISVDQKLQEICEFLKNNKEHYHWVGFYFVHEGKNELKLSQFVGKPTEHTLIPFGKGICGQVALSNKNFVVQDVTEQENYISCGINVKSEIVVPIFVNEINIGQIDIDSHAKAPFDEADERLLEFVCDQVAKLDLSSILSRGSS